MKYIFLLMIIVACNSKGDKTPPMASEAIDSAQIENLKREDSLRDVNQMQAEILEQAKPAYTKAYVEVYEMIKYVEMADSGQLDKNRVITMYNSGLGRTMGQYKTIGEIKKKLKESGDGYIEMMWYKEAARIANEKAANADFESKQNN